MKMIHVFSSSLLSLVLPLLARAENPVSQSLAWEFGTPDSYQAQHLDTKNSHKIFWWNIGCGNHNSNLKQKKNIEPLYQNISTLAQSNSAPEILVFGEHCPSRMPKNTQATLAKHYSYSFHLPKSNPYKKTKNGILVYSKYPLELIRKENLEVGLDAEETINTTRTYLLLKVRAPEGDFYLSPVHFYNPWGKMGIAEFLTSALGTDNANYRQAALHLQYLKEDVNLSTEKVLVIGDFNAAKNFAFLASMATYNLFASELMDRGGSFTTFPAASAVEFGNSFPEIQIDHAFSSAMFEGELSAVDLQGSDHYPVVFVYQ